jgi:threonine/homoserine/homoserine lactone efflux protein
VIEYIVLGAGFAFAAGVQPGPLQAFLLSQVAERGWRRTLPASFAPVVSDGPIALLILLVLRHLPGEMTRILHAVGGIVLLYFAAMGFRRWRRPDGGTVLSGISAPRTLIQAVVVNLLNPGPYLGWSLILGPAAIEAWAKGPPNAVALVVAFYGTMAATLAATIILFGTTRVLGPRGRRIVLLASVVALALLGIYQLAEGLLRPGGA